MTHFVSYTISFQDLVKSWIQDICPNDHILIVYDPLNNYDYLKGLGFDMDDGHIYESKLMVSHFIDIELAIRMLKRVSFLDGPLCELWSKGMFITDNSVNCTFDS
tara:strand:- start:12476 stop:12790 length:315 start_codon:yes stop_codon:yes gene_type:complete